MSRTTTVNRASRLTRILAALAVLAWLGLAAYLAWPSEASATPPQGVRVCYRDDTAARIYPMPGGRQMAISDGTCHYQEDHQ